MLLTRATRLTADAVQDVATGCGMGTSAASWWNAVQQQEDGEKERKPKGRKEERKREKEHNIKGQKKNQDQGGKIGKKLEEQHRKTKSQTHIHTQQL